VTRTLAGTDHETAPDPESDSATSGTEGGVEGLDRLRLLLAGAMGTVLLSYALLVPAAAVVIFTAGGAVSVDGAFAAAIPLWLAAHQIPLVLEGQPLSVLPLLPTAGVATVIAVGAGWSARRLGGRPRHDAGAVLAAVAGAHSAAAVLGSALLPRAAEVAVAPWSAMVGGGLVSGVAAAAGVLRACGLPADQAARLPGWLRPALHATAVALVGLACTGSAVLLTGLVLQADAVATAYSRLAPGFGAGVGVTFLAIAYLPNAVLGGLSWALGPGVMVGAATTSPFVTNTAEASSFPLLAALPSGVPPVWALLVFVLPIGVGLLAGTACRRAAPVRYRFSAALATTGLTTAVAGLLAVLSGGRLATGPFDPVRLPVELLVPAVLLWVGLPIMLLAVLRAEPLGTPAVDGAEDDRSDLEQAEADPERGSAAGGSTGGGEPDGPDAGGTEADRADGDVAGSGAGEDRPDADGTGGGGDGTNDERPDVDGSGGAGDGAEDERSDVDGTVASSVDADGAGGAGDGAEDDRPDADGAVASSVAADRAGAGDKSSAEARSGAREKGETETARPDRRGRTGSARRGARTDRRRDRPGAEADDSGDDRAVPRRVPAARRLAEQSPGRRERAAERGSRRRWWRRAEPVEPSSSAPEQRGPRTVGELVAQRAREAAEQEAAAERRDDSS
jgi:hypothetical protein